jgi:2,4-dienoyl-CoA reductase (NADPH2)
VRDAGFDLPVFLQGSVVDVNQAEEALGAGVCDGVEMTRAQIADPDLVAKVRSGQVERIRPCILCNQACQVRDARNPIVSCVGEPSAGHETEDVPIEPRDTQSARDLVSGAGPSGAGAARGQGARDLGSGAGAARGQGARDLVSGAGAARGQGARDLVVVGGGPAGLEAARVAAWRGHRVRLFERSGALGGSLRIAATAQGRHRLQTLVDWLVAECRRLGVTIYTDTHIGPEEVARLSAQGTLILLCTGSTDGDRSYEVDGGTVFSAREWLLQRPPLDGPVAVFDPIGGPIGVSVAETLATDGHPVHLITQDQVAGNELARTGDLAPANARLQQAGVIIERRSVPRLVRDGAVEVEDRFTGGVRTIAAVAVVDAGFRLPDHALWEATDFPRLPRAGDAVAPRTVYEAVLEARRAVLALEVHGHSHLSAKALLT